MEDQFHGLDMKLKEKELKNKYLQDKVKELESQLLVERKLERQHVDMKNSDESKENQQLDDHRLPLVSKPLNTYKISDESKENQQSLINKNITYKLPAPLPPPRDLVNLDVNDFVEKENNPYLPEQFIAPKRTGRASICTTTSQRVPVRSVSPRRNSLIPLPSDAPVFTKYMLQLYRLSSIKPGNENLDETSESCMEDSLKRSNGSGKKLMGALRRSFKKNQVKSPMMMEGKSE
ncbi:unnamed protein product [Lactuca saligna]|uniref:Uncharacterized protein n=1 Tax=Lactuca saligna TaxID=75948 RepID=A0AA35YR71_LACSI|nr:unnamed protein product [Lactuca saligna]